MNHVKNRFFSFGLLTMALASLGSSASVAAREPSFIMSQGAVAGAAGADGSVISQTNAARARHGLPPLAVDSQPLPRPRRGGKHRHGAALRERGRTELDE